MLTLLTYFLLATSTGFVGALPFGTVNLSVIYTSLKKGHQSALWMSLGAAIIEIGHVFLAIFFSNLISSYLTENPIIKLSIGLLLVMIGAVLLMKKSKEQVEEEQKSKGVNPFWKGVFLSIINPQAVPFWVFIISYYTGQGWIELTEFKILAFIIGVGLGRFLSLWFYAVMGQYLNSNIKGIGRWVDKGIGLLLVILGSYQLWW